MTAALDVKVNGNATTVAAGTTVGDLVERLGTGTKGVAVAVNSEVVPRSKWGTVEIRAGDSIEVLRAAQGG